MTKTRAPLLWRQLHQTLNPTSQSLRTSAQACTALSRHHARPFHTTEHRPARQAPSLRDAERHKVPTGGKDVYKLKNGLSVDRDGFWWGALSADVNIMLGEFEEAAHILYEMSNEMNLIPPGVNFATFKSVGEQVIRKSHSELPSAKSVRTISIDVDAVYRIAFMLMVLPKGQLVLEWTRNACAQAKSRRALTEVVNRYIEIPAIDIHRNNEWIATVKDFALVDGYPQAIMLYAKILTWRGETAQAASLLEKEILPYISPVARKPVVWKDLTLYGTMDSPLRLYSLAIADTKGIAAAAELVRRAAIEYSEPIALTEIAIAQLETNNFEKYEEYMTMAASAGYGNACYHLANYYYRVSTGEFASAEEEAVKRKQARSAEGAGLFSSLDGIREWADSLVHKPLTRKDYLKLASEWYNVAFATGVSNAGFILALISRNAGDLEESRMMYDAVPQENLLKYLPAKALRELDTRWDDPTFEPGLPPKLLRLG